MFFCDVFVLVNFEQFRESVVPRWKERPFVVFEGINGSGKTTLLREAVKILEQRRVPNKVTREPGGSKLGVHLRQILLEQTDPIDPWAELFLFQADRAQHLAEVIKPSLAKGEAILCDRYYFSTLAFQCFGRHLEYSSVAAACQLAVRNEEPALVLLIDLPVDVALGRVRQRGEGNDRFEREQLDFQERVRQGYLEVARQIESVPFLVMDGCQPAAKLADDLNAVFQVLIGD